MEFMLSAQRRRVIRELVADRGVVELTQLAIELQVSRETLRRDLNALTAAGAITRVRGGAARKGWSGRRGDLALRDPHRQLKNLVAGAAAKLVTPGQTVALSAGSTTCAVARALIGIPDLTVVTNSLPAARVLRAASAGPRLILTGGVAGIVGALLGPIALNTVRALNVDWLLMGTNGVDGSAGVTAYDLGEAELHREWVRHARDVAVVTDHSKWGIAALKTVVPLRDVTVLVTDDGLPDDAQRLMREQVRQLVLTPAVP
jgi:DeoR/GlpR family transcriptional regulator of sugar metabolism